MPISPPLPELLARARTGRRRRRGALVAGAFVVALLAITIPMLVLGRHQDVLDLPALGLPGYAVPVVAAYPRTGPGTAAALRAGTWAALPQAPIAGRSGAATVWTGDRMLVWGGSSGDQLYGDGATYDPVTRQWQVVPAAPLTARAGMAYGWTGGSLVIWGGYDGVGGGHRHTIADGARYDVAARTWRPMARSPLAPRFGATALWTGREVVIIGGYLSEPSGNQLSYLDAAAYDPGTDRWRRLPSIPSRPLQPVQSLVAAATSDGIYVWLFWQRSAVDSISFQTGVNLLRYDPLVGGWAQISTGAEASHTASDPLWTGRELVFPAAPPFVGGRSGPSWANLHGWRLDPDARVWRQMTHGPVDDLRPDSVWTGAALLCFDTGTTVGGPDGTTYPGAAEVWDPYTDSWTRLPDAPFAGWDTINAVWTGTALLEWGLMYPSHEANGAPADVTAIGLSFGP